MQLLLFTDYALRVLIYLGVHPERTVPTAEIAHAYAISVDHVTKAAKALTRQGLLRAVRGASGGLRLAKPAEQIGIGDVVRRFEADRVPVTCLRSNTDDTRCAIEVACTLRGAFERAQAAFYQELDRYSLADLLTRQSTLVRLLKRADKPSTARRRGRHDSYTAT